MGEWGGGRYGTPTLRPAVVLLKPKTSSQCSANTCLPPFSPTQRIYVFYCTVRSYVIVISFAVRNHSRGVTYQPCGRGPKVIVFTQSTVAQWHFALCPVSVSTAFRLSRQFRGCFADNHFSILVLIILFAQALNQARFIFYVKKAAQKSAPFKTKSTCDITSCGLHKHLHSLSFEIFSYGRNCKYNLLNKMFIYKKNGCEEMKRNQLYENFRPF